MSSLPAQQPVLHAVDPLRRWLSLLDQLCGTVAVAPAAIKLSKLQQFQEPAVETRCFERQTVIPQPVPKMPTLTLSSRRICSMI